MPKHQPRPVSSSGSAVTYATWNPSDKAPNVTLSNGNLTAVGLSSGDCVRATVGKSSGKWYWEVTTAGTINSFGVGVTTSGTTITIAFTDAATGYGVIDIGWKGNNGSYTAGYTSAYSTGDIMGILLDMDAGTIEIRRNGVANSVMFSGLTGTFYPAVQGYTNLTANFGASAFTYSVPSGYNSGLY